MYVDQIPQSILLGFCSKPLSLLKKLQLGTMLSISFNGLVLFLSMAANCFLIFFSMTALELENLHGSRLIIQSYFFLIFIDLDRYCKFEEPTGRFYLFSMLNYRKLLSSGSLIYWVLPRPQVFWVCTIQFEDSVLRGDGLLIKRRLILFSFPIGLLTIQRGCSKWCLLESGVNFIGVLLQFFFRSWVSFQALISFLTIILCGELSDIAIRAFLACFSILTILKILKISQQHHQQNLGKKIVLNQKWLLELKCCFMLIIRSEYQKQCYQFERIVKKT